IVAKTVVVESPLSKIDAVGDSFDCLPLQLRGLPEDLIAGCHIAVVAEAVEYGLKPPLACPAGGNLGIHVPDQGVAEATVALQQIDDVLARPAPFVYAGRGPPHSFLEDLMRVHRAAGVLGADVEPVG